MGAVFSVGVHRQPAVPCRIAADTPRALTPFVFENAVVVAVLLIGPDVTEPFAADVEMAVLVDPPDFVAFGFEGVRAEVYGEVFELWIGDQVNDFVRGDRLADFRGPTDLAEQRAQACSRKLHLSRNGNSNAVYLKAHADDQLLYGLVRRNLPSRAGLRAFGGRIGFGR